MTTPRIIISAFEALAQKHTQLTEEDNFEIEALLKLFEEGVAKMRRNGFEITTTSTNAAATFEVSVLLQEAGWIVMVQPRMEPSGLRQGQMTHVGYTLLIQPSKEAVVASHTGMRILDA